ncbi:hypothetical protein GGR56DRAFT_533956 [Xylariaceae sp. FL0804]|nr:hypothetical protein GGR56DRAFT_533956 [Xylariaceae sp. FL0804]
MMASMATWKRCLSVPLPRLLLRAKLLRLRFLPTLPCLWCLPFLLRCPNSRVALIRATPTAATTITQVPGCKKGRKEAVTAASMDAVVDRLLALLRPAFVLVEPHYAAIRAADWASQSDHRRAAASHPAHSENARDSDVESLIQPERPTGQAVMVVVCSRTPRDRKRIGTLPSLQVFGRGASTLRQRGGKDAGKVQFAVEEECTRAGKPVPG